MPDMIYTDKVAWLRRYQESLRREKELAEEVERLQSEATRITPLLSGMPGGAGDGQKLLRSVERIVQVQKELQEQIDRCADVRGDIAAVIAQVTNHKDHEILRRRYILGQRWEYIAVQMKIELRWVYRRHRNAVCRLTIESH